MSGQIVPCRSVGEEDFYSHREDFSVGGKLNGYKIDARDHSFCISDLIVWNNLRNKEVFSTNQLLNKKTVSVVSWNNHLKDDSVGIQSLCSCDTHRDRSQSTIADILEHCGNGDWGTAVRDSLESTELHEALNEAADGIELGFEVVASAIADVIGDMLTTMGEIEPP